jgi:UDP-N-acetylglucosamine--N-acetylmuramyl-(pentapeptide) pyrophosphoryl-undecaprenol N-acetylglucosamine transferase
MNILIVCGGTGGHLFPGIAVGEELLERKHQVLLVVSEKEIDQKALKGARGFLVQTLPAVGWRGLQPQNLFRFCWMMWKAIGRTRQIFRDFHPDVVLGMGGFSSVAPLLVAWYRKIPCCVHESNAIAGKANRLAARLVNVVAVGLDKAKDQFCGKKCVATGTPIRECGICFRKLISRLVFQTKFRLC